MLSKKNNLSIRINCLISLIHNMKNYNTVRIRYSQIFHLKILLLEKSSWISTSAFSNVGASKTEKFTNRFVFHLDISIIKLPKQSFCLNVKRNTNKGNDMLTWSHILKLSGCSFFRLRLLSSELMACNL